MHCLCFGPGNLGSLWALLITSQVAFDKYIYERLYASLKNEANFHTKIRDTNDHGSNRLGRGDHCLGHAVQDNAKSSLITAVSLRVKSGHEVAG